MHIYLRSRHLPFVALAVGLLASAVIVKQTLATSAGATNLTPSWSNWSWQSSVVFVPNTSRINITSHAPYSGFFLHSDPFSVANTPTLHFDINGLDAGTQVLTVALESPAPNPFKAAVPLAPFIKGNKIPKNDWVPVNIPLSALGLQGTSASGFFLQDARGVIEPPYSVRDITFNGASLINTPVPTVTSVPVPVATGTPAHVPTVTPGPTAVPAPTPTSVPVPTVTPKPVPTNTPVLTNTNFGSSQPFNLGFDESYQSKGAEQWMPEVKAAVNDAVNAHLLNESERIMFENILVGTINVESTGHVFLVASNQPSYGLTQGTVPWLEYAEENPFDPLINMRGWLRNVIQDYRHSGNRWDQMVSEYLTGQPGDGGRYSGDGNTTGQSYFQRVVNAVWWVHYDFTTGNVYPAHDNAYQQPCNGPSCYYDHAPSWSIWSSPNLVFNWIPTSNTNGYNYYKQGVDSNINLPINKNTWYPVPDWFYTASPEANIPVFVERAPTATEAQQNPPGHTVMTGVSSATYPMRTWPGSNP